jgi:hypothetical protein
MAFMSWYSVRCVFKDDKVGAYEERITLWQAETFDEAIAHAEEDAREYASTLHMEYLDFAQAYWLPDDAVSNGSEVFSLMRDSDLEPREYLDQFFDTGTEYQQTTPPQSNPSAISTEDQQS